MSDIEFNLTKKQVTSLGDRPTECSIIVGSIQRHSYPAKPDYYFRGRWVTGTQAERLRKAAKKLKPTQ